MNATWSTLLTVGVPLFIVWLTVKAAPDFVGKLLLKPFDYASEARLARLRDQLGRETSHKVEALKAELQATYSTLQTSVDIVSAGQSGMRDHTIASVATLWSAILDLRTDFGGLVVLGMILTKAEMADVAKGKTGLLTDGYLQNYKDEDWLQQKTLSPNRKEIEGARLFCGDRLWLIFYVTRAVYTRNAWLMVNSLKHRSYTDWTDDNGIPSLLASALPADVIEFARSDRGQGLQEAINRLEADFLREATRVMSGSKAISDSLSDMQAVMQLQQQKIREETSKRDEQP